MAEGGSNMQSNNVHSDSMQQSQQGSLSTDERELVSKTLHIQSKRFYLDVKQNRRGRFIKIAEVSAGGRKSRIIMSMNVAGEFSNQLMNLEKTLENLGEYNPQNSRANEDAQLFSASITRDDRRYYLDLKQNDRGRFLRISMVSVNNRTQIAVPIQGLKELRETLNELLDEYGDDEDKDSIESPEAIEFDKLPESKSVRVGNKHFYFDIGSNDRGVFLRISEVRPNFRAAITIPEKAWPRFRDNIDDFISLMTKERNEFVPNPSSLQTNAASNSGTAEKAAMSPDGDTKN